MQTTLTLNNQLYLYQLLSETIGVGKQTLLPRVEEALAQDGIEAADLGAESVRTAFELLDSFIELKVFKGGRVYVIVRQQPEWDALLAKAEKAAGKAAASGKPWKRQKKAVKPVKPRRKRERKPKKKADEASSAPAAAETPAVPSAQETNAPEPDDADSAAPVRNEAAAAEAGNTDSADTEAVAPVAEAPTVAAQPAENSADEGAQAAADAPAPAATAAAAPAPAENLIVAPDDNAATDGADAPTASPAAPAEPAEAASRADAPAAPEPRDRISLTITYVPDDEPAAEEPEPQSAPAPVAPQTRPTAPAAEHAAPATGYASAGSARRYDYPASISQDVHCRQSALGLLMRILPVQVDLMALLDEDWRVARSTGTLQGGRNRVTFPLRFLREDGSAPVEVTMKRSGRPGSGARWEIALVDGDDGTGSAHEAVGLDGLPREDEGAWADLSAQDRRAGTLGDGYSPVRAFAQFALIGSWDALLGELARTAGAERWNTDALGGGRYGILREYLAVTFARLSATGGVLVSQDGSLAVFNTGLWNATYEDICACFEPSGADIPWRFAGFAVAGSGELGQRITAEFGSAPRPASYLTSLDEIVPNADALVVPDYRALLGPCLERLPRGFLHEHLDGSGATEELLRQATDPSAQPLERAEALRRLARAIDADAALRRRMCRALDDAIELAVRRCQRSYRTAAPAYDPRDEKLKLLLPMSLVDDRATDCAAVLDRMPSGAYQAASIVSLPRAYACARVVSPDMPAWLDPKRVLG